MPDGDDRSFEAERVGQRSQIGDPVREAPNPAGALGEAHFELVDGDDPPCGPGAVRLRSIRSIRDQAAPQVRPGGVAVNAEQRADRHDARRVECGTGIEQMPLGAPSGDDAREIRRQSGQAGRRKGCPHAHAYQAISSIEVFSPEPTPMSSTRSPERSDAASCARVIGIEAGPMLPSIG